MTAARTLFGLRYDSNPEVTPTNEELARFINAASRKGAPDFPKRELTAYGKMVESLEAFREASARGEALRPREVMFYRVLGNSRLCHPGLQHAVEEFLYHLHALSQLDFRKPLSFIRAAGDEMLKLDPKKKKVDANRLVRLQDLIAERKNALKQLERQAAVLTVELRHILVYIRDNLVRVQNICEASIVVLVELQLSRQEEKRLVDAIRDRVREQYEGQAGKAAEPDWLSLSKEMATLFREDLYSLACLYEAIRNHTLEVVHHLDLLFRELDAAGKRSAEDDRELFVRASGVLAHLIGGQDFVLETTEFRSNSAFGQFIAEERRELLGRLFALLEKERRTRTDRRSGKDRRTFWEKVSQGPEQRILKERRTGRSRRTALPLYSQKNTRS